MKTFVFLTLLVLVSICAGNENGKGSESKDGEDVVHNANYHGEWTVSLTKVFCFIYSIKTEISVSFN